MKSPKNANEREKAFCENAGDCTGFVIIMKIRPRDAKLFDDSCIIMYIYDRINLLAQLDFLSVFG